MLDLVLKIPDILDDDSLKNKDPFVNVVSKYWNQLNSLGAIPTKWSNTPKRLSVIADELFECVWSFCGAGT